MIPDVPKAKDSYYQRKKKHKLFCKRAGIEPTIGHLKSDYRLGRNFYKGFFGDVINVILTAAAYNFKRAMKILWNLINKISEMLQGEKILLKFPIATWELLACPCQFDIRSRNIASLS